MSIPERFTLRREYFGGVLHDAETMQCHILTHTEYDILLKAAQKSHVSVLELIKDELNPEVTKLRQIEAVKVNAFGGLVLVNTRIVPEPTVIPDHCLTAPIRVYHSFTRRCNLDCPQCCLNSNADFTEQRMTLEQFEKVVQKFYEAGTMEWRFTGGEPTFCSDFIDAVRIAKSFGMAVMLNTNACWSEELTEKILQAGLIEIIISLEGSEEVNDSRRSPGTYRKILKVMDQISHHNKENPEKKIRVTINMTIGRDNVREVEFVVRLGAKYGYNVNFVPLRPYGRTPSQLPETMLSTEEFMRFSENVQRLREDPEIQASGIRVIHRNMDLFCPDYPDKSQEPYPFNYSDCGALATGFGLCPDGRVNACSFLMNDEEFLGPNMIDVSVQEAWLHPKMEHFRRAKKLGCHGCRFYMRQCEGKCRAMVLAEGGKIENGKLIGRDRYCFAHLMSK